MLTPKDLWHPLAALELVETSKGKIEAPNGWMYASVVWAKIVFEYDYACIQSAREIFTMAKRADWMQLVIRSRAGDMVAVKEAQNIIALTFEDGMQLEIIERRLGQG